MESDATLHYVCPDHNSAVKRVDKYTAADMIPHCDKCNKVMVLFSDMRDRHNAQTLKMSEDKK